MRRGNFDSPCMWLATARTSRDLRRIHALQAAAASAVGIPRRPARPGNAIPWVRSRKGRRESCAIRQVNPGLTTAGGTSLPKAVHVGNHFQPRKLLCAMCLCRSPHCLSLAPRAFSRRKALQVAVGLSSLPVLAGCDEIAPLIVPDGTVEQLGLQTWARLAARMPPSRNPAAQRLVERTSMRLLTTAGEDPATWEVRVFAEPGVNAFVLPGRKIGVLEGMVRLAGSEDELAAVIGHEIGHLQADHPEERLAAETIRHWGLRLISFLLDINEVAFAREIAALLGVGTEFGLVRPYGRAQELEADRLGVFMMAKAGYEPQAAAELWRRMDRQGGGIPALLSTHPAPQDRIAAIEAMIPEARRAATG
jgi:Zn-dependent protease with chaperone function